MNRRRKKLPFSQKKIGEIWQKDVSLLVVPLCVQGRFFFGRFRWLVGRTLFYSDQLFRRLLLQIFGLRAVGALLLNLGEWVLGRNGCCRLCGKEQKGKPQFSNSNSFPPTIWRRTFLWIPKKMFRLFVFFFRSPFLFSRRLWSKSCGQGRRQKVVGVDSSFGHFLPGSLHKDSVCA